jgi:hypothetical protein
LFERANLTCVSVHSLCVRAGELQTRRCFATWTSGIRRSASGALCVSSLALFVVLNSLLCLSGFGRWPVEPGRCLAPRSHCRDWCVGSFSCAQACLNFTFFSCVQGFPEC